MKNNLEISLATFKRLPLYLRILKDIKNSNIENVSSTVLAKELSLTGIQVRKDLAQISDSEGKAGIGFKVEELIKNIEELLGLNSKRDAVIIGAGKLGKALLNYNNFGKEINMLMAFDNDINVCDNKKIFYIDKMENLINRFNIKIGIITTPKENAQEMANKLVQCGIRAIWNFAPVTLKVTKDVVVKNEDLSTSLLILLKKLDEINLYNLNKKDFKEDKNE